MHQFDHRYATFESVNSDERLKGNTKEVTPYEKGDVWSSQPRHWVVKEEVWRILKDRKWSNEWIIGYRDITNATNERTAIASILPIGGAAQPLNLFLPESADLGAIWLAAFNSFIVDYIVRQTIGGVHLNITTCRQLPILSEFMNLSINKQMILNSICELTYTSPTIKPFAKDCGYDGPPFRWDEDRRFLLRCELDAAYFHLYGITRDDVDYVMETFPIVKRKDEKKHGEYRTKRVILEIYDEMAEAMRSGEAYQTRLNPPPADPRVAHPPRVKSNKS